MENRSQMYRNWVEFYNETDITNKPSPFAIFAINYFPSKATILDMGCGNKRDTNYFRQHGFKVNSVDPYSKEEGVIKKRSLDYEVTEDVVYSRFFLHSISDHEITDLISKTPNLFIAECRAKGDVPKIFNHRRNFVDPKWLMELLKACNFDIRFIELNNGLAKYKNEDPFVFRIIAQKK